MEKRMKDWQKFGEFDMIDIDCIDQSVEINDTLHLRLY